MSTKKTYRTAEDRHEEGRRARKRTPRRSHDGWEPTSDRPDPVTLLTEQDETREQDLVPVRHGRMLASPFAFYRGAARIMAHDLATTPVSGITVQACGDAHLANFGLYGSPERQLLFDVNDFDETLPGPWEWDVKRLATSITVAARANGFSNKQAETATAACVAAYREAMGAFADMRQMDVWYAHVSAEQIAALATRSAVRREIDKQIAKSRSRDSMQALSKLTEVVDGKHRIVADPPLIVPLSTYQGIDLVQMETLIREAFADYRRTLADDRKHLLERFQLVDIARKVPPGDAFYQWYGR